MSSPLPLDCLLIANRGEIALRVARSAQERGLRVVMVFTEADQGSLHARAGDLALRVGDYLDGAALVALAQALPGRVGVHPGYGFLAENAAFARQVQDAGLVWVGPPPAAIAAMGDKAAARQAMAALGVPVVPGYDGDAQDDASLIEAGVGIGTPLMVKAAAGGGGKGMRRIDDPAELPAALGEARRLAQSAFGDPRLLLERVVDPARHIEVQVLADAHGAAVHLFERECSLQRRHQKVIEEAPAPNLDATLRAALHRDALKVARSVGYQGAGTVEFLVGPGGEHFFLEMNTRIQVEHPVTEAITGLDLVDLQLHVAEGRPLPFSQDQVQVNGWSIEGRICAEDARQGWLPSSGRLRAWTPPPGLRLDSGVQAGAEIGTRYDALLAKLVAHGSDREQARRRLAQGLRRLVALGPTTTRTALLALVEDPRFVAGTLSTTLLQGWSPPPVQADRLALFAALAALHLDRRADRPLAEVPAGWRNLRWRDSQLLLQEGERLHRLRYRELSPGLLRVHEAPAQEAIPAEPAEVSTLRARRTAEGVELELDGRRERVPLELDGDLIRVHRPEADLLLRVLSELPEPGQEAAAAGSLRAPMPGTVVAVEVVQGQSVEQGQVLVRLEAMKMEQAVRAPLSGTVEAVRVKPGQAVTADQVLIELSGQEDQDANGR